MDIHLFIMKSPAIKAMKMALTLPLGLQDKLFWEYGTVDDIEILVPEESLLSETEVKWVEAVENGASNDG